MINDMDMKCKKCGGTLQRKALISSGTSAREYECQCIQCKDKTIVSYESTCLDFDDQINESDS